MKRRLADIGAFQFTKSQSTITLEPQSDGIDLDAAVERLQKVFGIARLSRAAAVPKDMDVILEQSAQYLKDTLELYNTFKVEAKRSDKK
ncbi:MAG: THUMP domain-containing protein, partial [Clostridiales bacterium]|nr:THUMP domain-containing protein [Clostridiales bacterium]